ncbi:MAG: hypothetical protein WC976_07250 [Caldisericia bacterium]
MKTLKNTLFFLLVMAVMGIVVGNVFAEKKYSPPKLSPKEEKIIAIFNSYVNGLKQLEKEEYNFGDAKLIDEYLSLILSVQNRAYVNMKSIDNRHTKYTSLSFRVAFDVMNEIALGTINRELEFVHRIAGQWNRKKSFPKNRATADANMLLWKNASNRLSNLWNIYYSWDVQMNSLTRNSDMYPAYCVLSKTAEGTLADHKLAMKVLWEKWDLDESNILYDTYVPIGYKLEKRTNRK